LRTTIALLVVLGFVSGALAAPPEGMVLVPEGTLRMGSDEGADESPVHEVRVKAFHMDIHEVRNAEFEKFLAAGGYDKKELWSDEGWAWRQKAGHEAPESWERRKKDLGDAFPSHPVTGVCFWEAEAYARFVGKRLPTESEWEWAARGKDGRKYSWGEDEEAGGPAGAPETRTRPAGSNVKDRTPEGVLDLGGNVAEWTASWYDAYPGSELESRYFGERYRVIRGGSWRWPSAFKRRGAWRGYWRNGKPDSRSSFVGIRLVKDVPEEKPEK
jgi:iron(II)-dependent oxidoreductase